MSENDLQGVTYRFPSDLEMDEPPTDRLIRAVATIPGEQQLALEPLSSVTDPEALDRIITHAQTRSEQPLTVSFTWAGCEITITREGHLKIRAPTD